MCIGKQRAALNVVAVAQNQGLYFPDVMKQADTKPLAAQGFSPRSHQRRHGNADDNEPKEAFSFP